MGRLVLAAMLTRIRMTRLTLGMVAGLAVGFLVAPLVLMVIVAIYNAVFPGAMIQCDSAAMQTVVACRPSPLPAPSP